MENHEIIKWIRKLLYAEYYTDFQIEIEGESSSRHGASSRIIFAKIIITDGKSREVLHIAVKFSKPALRLLPAIRAAYRKEIRFYETVANVIEELQTDVEGPFVGLSKCYNTFADSTTEIIVLENLRYKGYKLHRVDLPMSLPYIELVLTNFAKFHALCFALKEKNGRLFDELAETFKADVDIIVELDDFFKTKPAVVVQNLRDSNRKDLADELEKLIAPGVANMVKSIVTDKVDNVAIAHFDCHCNNFMFKFEGTDEGTPTNVAILDWQLAKMHSPAIDVSYFLHTVCSKQELARENDLLKYYHDQLGNFLTKLDCNVDISFPYTTFLEHWKKYRFYGFSFACCFMDFNFLDENSFPKFDDANENNNVGKIMSETVLKNPTLYRQRLVNLVEHYLRKPNN